MSPLMRVSFIQSHHISPIGFRHSFSFFSLFPPSDWVSSSHQPVRSQIFFFCLSLLLKLSVAFVLHFFYSSALEFLSFFFNNFCLFLFHMLVV